MIMNLIVHYWGVLILYIVLIPHGYECHEHQTANCVSESCKQESYKSARLNDYMKERNKIIDMESKLMTGGGVVLTTDEQKVNDLVLSMKRQIFDEAFKTGYFPLTHNFLKVRTAIEKDPLYRIIKSMPKGGILHIHDVSLFKYDWLIQNATYRPHCYMCLKTNNSGVLFRFSENLPKHIDDCTEWNLVSDLRSSSDNSSRFDSWLLSLITFSDNLPENQYKIWQRFEACLWGAAGLLFYEKVYSDYLYEALKVAREDGVDYLEIRAVVGFVDKLLYDIKGNLKGSEHVVTVIREVTQRFMADNSDFIGVRVIPCAIRLFNQTYVENSMQEMVKLYKAFPDIVIGFDLIGQEDVGHTLYHYIESLLFQNSKYDIHIPYFFHSGETDYFGAKVDGNLIDAVLLNATRIGHGYALTKHPVLLKRVKDKRIAIEVNPISNQVLGLVRDLRNHPMISLMAQDYPVVVSSDDPAVWHSDPLSHDFYVSFVAMSSQQSGISFIKQLAINSYTGLSQDDISMALRIWRQKWDAFITKVISEYGL